MKTNKKNFLLRSILIVAVIFGLSGLRTFAQGNFDYFAVPKTVVIQPSAVLTESSTNVLSTTNVIPIGRFLGIVALDLFSISNSVGNAGTAVYNPTNGFQLYSSPNGTNGFAPITNGLFAIPTSLIQTNYYGLTNSNVAYYTNTFMVPGTLTWGTVATDGYSGQRVVPAVPTASSIAASSAISTNWTIGFDADNINPYLVVIWSTSGSNAVYSVGGVLRGRTKAGQY